MARQRDLEGFQTGDEPSERRRRVPPPPRRRAVPSPPPATGSFIPPRPAAGAASGAEAEAPARRQPPPPAPAGRRARSDTSARRRVTLSLPTALAADLKRWCEAEGLTYRECFEDAHRRHGAAAASGDRSRLRRARRQPGRTQIPLVAESAFLTELDAAASALATDRSGYVTLLFDRLLSGPVPPSPAGRSRD